MDFHWIGTTAYCMAVRESASIEAMLAADILGQVADLVASVDPAVLERALQWA